ncbi:MAG: NnrS family protein [Alphaproteobacteria bacterium]|nr:MAG: NnrS family protein [Alphaproteobacteria bacterium]
MARTRYQGPAFLSHGFRPFFLGAGLAGLFLVPAWLHLFVTGADLPGHLSTLDWHRHEMIFGYLGAVVTGFLLTAIPNWTGRLPISGRPLLCLFLLWLAGRLVLFAPVPLLWAAGIDSLFPVLVAAVAAREVISGRNWRNLPVCLMAGLFAVGNIAFHAGLLTGHGTDTAVRLSLAVLTMLIAFVGGRIVPSFTTNWLIKNGSAVRPTPFGAYDKLVLAVTAVALVVWSGWPDTVPTAWLLMAAAVLHLIRLGRWGGLAARDNMLVLVLHVAYLWLPVGLALLATANFVPGLVPGQSAGLHALTAGLMGMMTLAVMTRATLGHTGRDLAAGLSGSLLYASLFVAAACRVAAPLTDHYQPLLMASGLLWCVAFLIFIARFGRMMLLPRAGA